MPDGPKVGGSNLQCSNPSVVRLSLVLFSHLFIYICYSKYTCFIGYSISCCFRVVFFGSLFAIAKNF